MTDKKQKELEETAEDYEAVAIEPPVRDIALPENEENTRVSSFTDKEDENEDITDMQAVMKRLFPRQKTNEENLAMVSRVHPDMFVSLIVGKSWTEIIMTPDDGKIDVNSIYNKNYGLFGIGLDGKGRIDALELGGAAKDTKMKEGNPLGV